MQPIASTLSILSYSISLNSGVFIVTLICRVMCKLELHSVKRLTNASGMSYNSPRRLVDECVTEMATVLENP